MYTDGIVFMPAKDLAELIDTIIKNQLEEFSKKDLKSKAEELMTVEEVCEFLHCTPPTLHKHKKQGLIKARRIGRRIYFLKDEILKSMETKNFKRK